jgi:hypothetical protein
MLNIIDVRQQKTAKETANDGGELKNLAMMA